MGQVKQAVLEVEDFVSACVRDGRTLNQTIRDARDALNIDKIDLIKSYALEKLKFNCVESQRLLCM